MSALDRHAPLITKTVTKRPIDPWFACEVKQKINWICSEQDTAVTFSNPSTQLCSACTAYFKLFSVLSEDHVNRLIMKSTKKSCSLGPMPPAS